MHLREWAPFEANAGLGTAGTKVKLSWVGTPQSFTTKVTRAEAPKVLEYGDLRWELEPLGSGTRLTLWHSIDRRFISWGAAGWHICFDVLERYLADDRLGRIVGPEAMKFKGWQRLVAEYSKQFGGGCSQLADASNSELVNRADHEGSHQTFNFSLGSHHLRHSDTRLHL